MDDVNGSLTEREKQKFPVYVRSKREYSSKVFIWLIRSGVRCAP